MSGFGEAKLRPTTSLTASFSARNSVVMDGKGGMNLKLVKNSDSTNGSRSHSQPSDKGKEPIREVSPFGRDANGAMSYSSYNSRPLTIENGRNRFRGSLVSASDALSFKFGRRKPSIRPPPRQIILPGVLEISARTQRQDEEIEERNRLREMAAQAIGLGPFMVSQGNGSRAESATEDEDEDQPLASENNKIPGLGHPRSSESTPNITTRSPHDSSFSEAAQPSAGRLRSGSMLVRSTTTTTAVAPIPPFPSTVLALTLFRQTSGMYPKYYPPSSLRIFALSKNWKNRFLVLSTPAKLVTRGQIPAVSYLHLFKSSSPDERELERLEINEDSVVFVSEEDVGGRRQVIKVGGADVGAMKKEYTYDEGGYTMWLLQITDQAEAQQWITNIKSAILGQRTIRAGLIPSSHTLGNHEPRGDMDVMLSIRTQALGTSPISKPRSTHSTSPNNASQDRHSTPSISSQSVTSQRTNPKSTGTSGPVSALKGLFKSTRSRSGSRAASVDFEKQQERENQDDLSANMRSLLSVLRPNTPDTPSVSLPVRKAVPLDTIDRRIDRKILTERQPVQWGTADQPPVNKDRANRALSLGAFSLQPPPRKHSVRPTSEFRNPDSIAVGKKTNRIALQVNDFSSGSRSPTDRAETESLYTTNQLSAFQFGIPEQDSRTPSVRSVSTVNSRDHRSSSSTNRSSVPRRWSRQGILPNQLTPPTEPPPAIPGNNLIPGPYLYSSERTSSPTPSRSSEKSVVSTLPPFSKRTSSSSVKTINSYDAARLHSIGTGASSSMSGTVSPRSSHRVSIPPPLPPPTVALPPAPVQEPQDTSTPSETSKSFRNSVAQRAFRLPTTAPKPPPSTSLPPRPDDSELKTHRRSLSGSYSIHGHSTTLEPIPGSPKSTSPFPPPVGPLPPTPIDLLPSPQLSPVKRPLSIKRRLRMLSAPLPSAGQLQDIRNSPARTSVDVSSSIFMTPPATPIGEKITLLQNDPTFLQMHIPTLPSQSLNLGQVPPLLEEEAGITSLSPPPRRGSRQLLETELEVPRRTSVPDEALLTVGGEPKHLSLSRPGSIMSINISACCQESDGDNSPFGVTPTDELPEELLEEKLTVEPRHLSLSRPGSVISLGIMTLQ